MNLCIICINKKNNSLFSSGGWIAFALLQHILFNRGLWNSLITLFYSKFKP